MPGERRSLDSVVKMPPRILDVLVLLAMPATGVGAWALAGHLGLGDAKSLLGIAETAAGLSAMLVVLYGAWLIRRAEKSRHSFVRGLLVALFACGVCSAAFMNSAPKIGFDLDGRSSASLSVGLARLIEPLLVQPRSR